MARIAQLFFITLLVWLPLKSWSYGYDAYLPVSGQVNVEFESQNWHYDGAANVCYRCIHSPAENLQEKALDGSFFAFKVDLVATKGGQDFFRGSRNGEAPDFTPRPNEFKVDKQTGLVKDTHGVSVFDNAKSVSDRGFTPNKIDQSTIPDSSRVIQRGNDPRHFEIVPKPGANLSPSEFTKACQSIKCGG